MADTGITVTEIVTDDVVAVEVQVGYRRYTGAAKRHPKDAPNRAIGSDLARSRAFAAAATDLEAIAQQTIEYNAISTVNGVEFSF